MVNKSNLGILAIGGLALLAMGKKSTPTATEPTTSADFNTHLNDNPQLVQNPQWASSNTINTFSATVAGNTPQQEAQERLAIEQQINTNGLIPLGMGDYTFDRGTVSVNTLENIIQMRINDGYSVAYWGNKWGLSAAELRVKQAYESLGFQFLPL